MKVYLVGGAVRDQLMGIEPHDRDYVIVGATKNDIARMLDEGYKEVGKSFPIFLHPETNDQYALARTKRNKGNKIESFLKENISLEDDLKRRDLTINSIAYDLEEGCYIDPFGGIEDIQKKVLRNTSDSFREDPLRILRVARFKCKYFDFELSEELISEIQYINDNLKESLLKIPKSRILGELKKTWDCKEPSIFFKTLENVNTLKILFSELDKLVGVQQPKEYHPEGDAFIHTMIVYDNIISLTKDEDCIFACLLHDLGKSETPKEEWPKHIAHEIKGLPLIEKFCKEYNFNKKRTNFILLFSKYHIKIHSSLNMNPKGIVKLFDELHLKCSNDIKEVDNSIVNLGTYKLNKFLLCAKADSLGKLNEDYLQGEFLIGCFEVISKVSRKEIREKLNKINKIELLDKKYYDKKISYLKNKIKYIRK